tara:strand:+ start:806 stop:913 length:108 start_codon:yes stop_codon:yes gene_type:complete
MMKDFFVISVSRFHEFLFLAVAEPGQDYGLERKLN